MPTLSRWFEEEQDRLIAAGKSALAESFQAFRAAAFEPDVPAVLATLPSLNQLADALSEPVWRLVADYYTIFVECHWRGDVASAVELATQASIRAVREPQARDVLALYLRESLLDAWLCAHAPRYAADVISAADEILGNPLPPDVVSRFAIIRASAAVTIDPTYGPAALDLVNEHLPALNWPDAYRRQMLGAALAWAERIDEALHETEAAAEGLNALNCHIEATEARLCAGALRLRLDDPDGALWTFRDALSSAERSINRAHVGFAQAGIGKALAALGDNDAAVEWLEAASGTLSGLGWQHAEEQIAEDHDRIVQEVHRTYPQTAAYETGNRAAPPRGAVISDGAEDWIV